MVLIILHLQKDKKHFTLKPPSPILPLMFCLQTHKAGCLLNFSVFHWKASLSTVHLLMFRTFQKEAGLHIFSPNSVLSTLAASSGLC